MVFVLQYRLAVKITEKSAERFAAYHSFDARVYLNRERDFFVGEIHHLSQISGEKAAVSVYQTRPRRTNYHAQT